MQIIRQGSTLSKEAAVYGSQVAKPVFHRADQWDKRKNIAMIDEHGTHTYGELSVKSRLVANALEGELGGDDERNKKVKLDLNYLKLNSFELEIRQSIKKELITFLLDIVSVRKQFELCRCIMGNLEMGSRCCTSE